MQSLIARILVTITAVSGAITLLISVVLFVAVSGTIRRSLTSDAEAATDQIVQSLDRALYELADDTALDIASAYLTTDLLVGIRLHSTATGTILDVEPDHPTFLPAVERTIEFQGYKVGTVVLWFNDARLRDTQRRLLLMLALVVLGMVATLAVVIRLTARRMLTRALDETYAGLERIAVGRYDEPIPDSEYREISELISTINGMSRSIREKDDELRAANRTLEERVAERTGELERSLRQLSEANKRLVVADRIMALGTLVTGVSHEINTPLGIAVTAASHLERELRDLHAAAGCVSETVSESLALLRRNLTRAADVVAQFRKAAGGQSYDEIVRFAIRPLVEETLASLAPRLDRRRVSVVLHGDPPPLRSYPGAIWPIVSNLVLNTLSHGYPGSEGGRVEIGLSSAGAGIRIDYRDYGAGIATDDQRRVFEPFFTTSRAAGGMGLGMYVVYTTVTDKLHGSIELESEPGAGVRVIIDIPSLAA